MKMFFKIFIVVAIAPVLCVMLPMGAFADNSSEEAQDVIEVAKEAELFAKLIRGKGYAAAYEYSQGIENDLTVFCAKHGYLDEESGEGVWMNPRKNPSEVKHLYYPFAKEFNTLEKWDDEVLNYFTSDFLELIPHSVSEYGFIYLREHQGKTYVGSEDSTEQFYSVNWDSVELTLHTEEFALLTVGAKNGYGYDNGTKTLHLMKTDKGWRVDGGTFWELDFADYEYTPPQTGEHTDLYALEEALPVAKDSYITLRLLSGGYRSLSRVVEPSEFWKDMDVLARNKGYIPADYYGKEPPLRYGDRMTSIAAWKEELAGYLDDDFLDRYMPTFERFLVYEKDGGTFAKGIAEWTSENEVDWSTVRIVSQDQDTITFSVIDKSPYSSEYDVECTVIMRKTADGWRVAGGTLFEEFIALIPPKTGERTGLYALIFTLAVLPLGVFAIGAFKKRRRGAV